MEKFTISLLGAKVTFVSSVPLYDYFIEHKDFMEFYNADVQKNADVLNDDYVIYYDDSASSVTPIVVQKNKMYVQYPFSELTPSIILYLASHFLEKQFGQMGICSCHSACVSKDGKATLIVGEAGAGKTSLAFNLCRKGYKLISNDMTLIGLEDGNLTAFAGTKFMNLRLLSVSQNMPELIPLFKDQEGDSWTNKISVMARDIGIEEEYDAVPIENVIFLRTDDRKPFEVTSGDTWRNNFLLYQNTSSHIRGSAATFIDKHGHPIGYIPSMETDDTYFKRAELLNTINGMDNYKYVVGPLSDIIEYVDGLYRTQEGVTRKYEKE